MATGLLLPIHETFYGEIGSGDLAWFLSCAQAALEAFGFSRIKTLHQGTDAEQELWGTGELTTEGMPPKVVTLEGEDAELEINWLDLINSSKEEILKALQTT